MDDPHNEYCTMAYYIVSNFCDYICVQLVNINCQGINIHTCIIGHWFTYQYGISRRCHGAADKLTVDNHTGNHCTKDE